MDSQKPYPRVLVVNPIPLPRSGATGQTLSRLFDGWPADRIAQVVVTSPLEAEPSFIADTYIASRRVIPLDSLARRVQSGGPAADVPMPAVSLEAEANVPMRVRLRRHISALVDVSPVMPDRALKNWVSRFAPEVVYSAMGNVRMLSLATRLADLARCPIVPHFMDDWPRTLHAYGELAGGAGWVMRRGLKRMFGRMYGGMTISAFMAEEYEKRYGLPFRDFMNCVDEAWFAPADAVKTGASTSFVYCGGLHLGREQVLLRLGEAIERVNAAGRECSLTIYTPDAQRHVGLFRELPHVHLESLAPSAVRPALAKANVLVHVESFTPAHIEYTRFSISTKVPEYLASGKAILGIGPGELASVKHLDRCGAAVVVTSPSAQAMEEQVAKLLDLHVQAQLGARGRAFAAATHAAATVRERFRTSLLEWSRKDR